MRLCIVAVLTIALCGCVGACKVPDGKGGYKWVATTPFDAAAMSRCSTFYWAFNAANKELEQENLYAAFRCYEEAAGLESKFIPDNEHQQAVARRKELSERIAGMGDRLASPRPAFFDASERNVWRGGFLRPDEYAKLESENGKFSKDTGVFLWWAPVKKATGPVLTDKIKPELSISPHLSRCLTEEVVAKLKADLTKMFDSMSMPSSAGAGTLDLKLQVVSFNDVSTADLYLPRSKRKTSELYGDPSEYGVLVHTHGRRKEWVRTEGRLLSGKERDTIAVFQLLAFRAYASGGALGHALAGRSPIARTGSGLKLLLEAIKD
jgi:hypothetical protein